MKRFDIVSIESPTMPRATELVGRDALMRQVGHSLAAARSVLLYGPEGVGKSAIIAALALDDVIVIDPFEHVTPKGAAQIRRALDRGTVHLAAARTAKRRALGAVGRILWRFSMIRVAELPDAIVSRIVTGELRRSDPGSAAERPWLHEIVALARGRPGFAVAMARFAVEWRGEHGYLPMPALAFTAMRQDAVIRSLRTVPIRPRSI